MIFGTQARADWRVLISAAVMGSGVGLALGALYMAGGMANAAAQHSRDAQLSQAVGARFGDSVAASSFAVAEGALRGPVGAAVRIGPNRARELDCLTQAVYFEARGETARGQAAVATVVLNRVHSPAFPKTVCGVVYQGAASHGCQFSFACDGSMRRGREADAWDRARSIAGRALSGVVLAEVGSATHFHTTGVSPGWGPQMLRVAQVGLHVFYRFNPHAPAAEPSVQHAVFTSLPTAPGSLRLAKAMLETAAEATVNATLNAPPPAEAAEPKPAPVLNAPPAGLSKANAETGDAVATADTAA